MNEYFRWAQGYFDLLRLFEDSNMGMSLTNIILLLIHVGRFCWPHKAKVLIQKCVFVPKINKFIYLQNSLIYPVLCWKIVDSLRSEWWGFGNVLSLETFTAGLIRNFLVRCRRVCFPPKIQKILYLAKSEILDHVLYRLAK